MNLNLPDYKDRLHACWIGKNIGGTMGAPYEGKRDIQDIQGFATKSGKVLPNDDLDLQLVWLNAVERYGLRHINARVLGEFWLSFITPFWNEYGIGKNNMRRGLPPPLSGDFDNHWRDSNGAWIRTEIWASLLPGNPDDAALFAIEDALVDHGAGEGTMAAAFVAAMQSAAYAIRDIRACIDIALAKVPESCRIAQTVRLAIKCHEDKVPVREARDIIQKANADIGDGWFEAPSNVGYTVLGLLYGEGDFKKSMIYAINCGDDTDCTGATVGATLGILGGTAAIPADWRAHVGDDIVTLCVNAGSFMNMSVPATCNELAERILRLVPHTLFDMDHSHHTQTDTTVLDAPEDIPADLTARILGNRHCIDRLNALEAFSFDTENLFMRMTTTVVDGPGIVPGGEKTLRIRFENIIDSTGNMPCNLRLRWFLPDGFAVDGPRGMVLPHATAHNYQSTTREFTVRVGERVEAENRLVLEVAADGRPIPLYVPVMLLG